MEELLLLLVGRIDDMEQLVMTEYLLLVFLWGVDGQTGGKNPVSIIK